MELPQEMSVPRQPTPSEVAMDIFGFGLTQGSVLGELEGSHKAVIYFSRDSVKSKLELDNLLYRIRIYCKLLKQSMGHSPELSDALTEFRNAIIDFDRYFFTVKDKPSKEADVSNTYTNAYLLLDKCDHLLRCLLSKIIHEVAISHPPLIDSHQNFLAILMACDLHAVRGLLLSNGCSDQIDAQRCALPPGTDDSVKEEWNDKRNGLAQQIEARKQELIGESNLALYPSSLTPEIHKQQIGVYFDKQQFLQQFLLLTRQMDADEKQALCAIYAFCEKLCSLLQKLQSDKERAHMELQKLDTLTRMKLNYLLFNLNWRINMFMEMQGSLPSLPTEMHSEEARSSYDSHTKETMIEHPETTHPSTRTRCEYPATDDDFLALLDTFETADEPLNFGETPEGLPAALEECCVAENVPCAAWSHSTKSEKSFVVHGQGITDDKKLILENKMHSRFPDYKFTFINSDPIRSDLSCMVIQRTCNKEHTNVQWFDNRVATCEVVMRGTQPHKGNRECVYAVTSAHLLLSDEQMDNLRKKENQQDAHRKLKDCRDHIQQRIDEYVYTALTESNTSRRIHLCNPPLISYSMLKHSHDGKPYDYMMDIALIPVERDNQAFIQSWVDTNEICRVFSILKLSPEHVVLMTKHRTPVIVYAKDRTGTIVPMERDVGQIGDIPSRGAHIPFILDDGCPPFEEGHSGSLIYIKSNDEKKAIGILRGFRPSEQNVYEAIVLQAALDEIQHDYRHLVANLSLLKPGDTACTGQAKHCGTVPVSTRLPR